MYEDGPSDDDLQRFGGDTGYCPSCGEEIWDQAEFCPSCGEHLSGHTSSRTPQAARARQFWIAIVILLILATFGLWVVL